MIKHFSRAFKITNENIILTTPLVFFLLLVSLYVGLAQNAPNNVPSAVLFLITLLFIASAFPAGWLYMVRKAVELDKKEFIIDEDKARASFGLLKEIPVGIGEYFLSFVAATLLNLLFIALIAFASYKLGLKFIGSVDLSTEQLKMLWGSPETIKTAITSMKMEQLIRLNAWYMLILSVSVVYSFITMFWNVQIVMKTKNAFFAFFESVRVIFKNFFSALALFLYLMFIYLIVYFLNAVSYVNPILYFVSMLIYFYSLVYIIVLLFLYYDREIKEKSDVQNFGDSGADSFGEDESGDTDSQDD